MAVFPMSGTNATVTVGTGEQAVTFAVTSWWIDVSDADDGTAGGARAARAVVDEEAMPAHDDLPPPPMLGGREEQEGRPATRPRPRPPRRGVRRRRWSHLPAWPSCLLARGPSTV